MRYYVEYVDNWILAVGTGFGGEEITKEEYEKILSIISGCPTPEIGYDYRLKKDLTWELVELPPAPESDPEISDAEALAIILGGGVL